MKAVALISIASLALVACSPSGESAETGTEAEFSDAELDELIPDDPEIADWIRTNYADMGDVLYASGEVDLDGDGEREVLVYVGGPMLCGTGGCNLVALQRTGQGLDVLGELSVSQLPIGVFDTSTNGWRDLAVSVHGGGMEGGVARVPFEEDQYASNPTVPPAELTEDEFTEVIADAPLQPLE